MTKANKNMIPAFNKAPELVLLGSVVLVLPVLLEEGVPPLEGHTTG